MLEMHWREVLELLARLLRYPNEQTVQAAESLYVILLHEVPLAARAIAAFGERCERSSLEELEEIYTRTFEINSKCAPEIGWHLFGEEFTRGMLLVRLREELERYGIPETTELPDHITHVLALVAAMPPEEADRFVPACLYPALQTMRASAERMNSPYLHVLACLDEVVRHQWGSFIEASTETTCQPADGADPLHAFPVLDAPHEPCTGCGPVIDPRSLYGEDDVPRSIDELDLPTDPRRGAIGRREP